MPYESTDQGVEKVAAEWADRFEATRYKITWKCSRCEKTYSKISPNPKAKDPLCQRKACVRARIEEDVERRAKNLAAMVESGVAPGLVGANNVVRAIDKTADIVMEDHKLTDLKDNIRMGDTMEPKLPPRLQSMADRFFDRTNNSETPIKRTPRLRQAVSGGLKRAVGGAYRNMAVPPTVAYPSGAKPGDTPYRVSGGTMCKVTFKGREPNAE